MKGWTPLSGMHMPAQHPHLLHGALQLPYLAQSKTNIGKLSLDQPLHLLAGTLSAEVQQAGDLIEAEPYCLCPPDESKTAYIARSIATYASCWALGYMQQAAALVIAYGLDMHIGGGGKTADR